MRKRLLWWYLCPFKVLDWNEDLFFSSDCNVLSAACFPWVNGWFDHNRWFIWALSCEWGCTVPSTNDRGSQAPSFCPSGAKNWSVWWVPVDYFTFFDLHHSRTTSLCYGLVSFNLLLQFSSRTADLFVLFNSFTFLSSFTSSLYFTSCIFMVPLSSTPLFLLLFWFFYFESFWNVLFCRCFLCVFLMWILLHLLFIKAPENMFSVTFLLQATGSW